MLMIMATDKATSEQVIITHGVVNKGKQTEEHTIRVFKAIKGDSVLVNSNLIGSYVISGDEAKELKAHLLWTSSSARSAATTGSTSATVRTVAPTWMGSVRGTGHGPRLMMECRPTTSIRYSAGRHETRADQDRALGR